MIDNTYKKTAKQYIILFIVTLKATIATTNMYYQLYVCHSTYY